MIQILSNSNEPSFNLATEEYFLKHKTEEYFILYVNTPCIVIGRNQNPYLEVNLDYIKRNDIPLYRRITGGGAVYHDLGNINFSFITNGLDHLNDYEYYINKITSVLNKSGVPIKFVEKSHIYLDNKKVSGNAQTFYKNRVLHHGTLLFDTDLVELNKALSTSQDIETKAIRSNRVEVTNVKEYIGYNELVHCLLPEYRELTTDEIQRIEILEKRYFDWSWNYGETPKFTYNCKCNEYEVSLEIRNGEIITVHSIGFKNNIADLVGKTFTLSSFENILLPTELRDKIRTLL